MVADRLRVFVSSKMQELETARKRVKIALDQIQIDSWVFEQDAGARPESIRATYLKEVERADLYIGMFWKGYGPYTIEEFEHARKLEKPCLVFEKRTELDARDLQLQTFLGKLEKVDDGVTIQWFTADEDLEKKLIESVARWQAAVVREASRRSRFSIDDRIRTLVPAVDSVYRDHLQAALTELRHDNDATAAVLALAPLVEGKGSLVERTGRGAGSSSTTTAEVAPELQMVQNTIARARDADLCKSMVARDAERAIDRALRLLEWYYCDAQQGPRLSSIFQPADTVRSTALVDPPASAYPILAGEGTKRLRFETELDSPRPAFRSNASFVTG